jgi:hypothetical protein
MSNEVYANGREVSCKAANGKSICAFPDVCLSPPSPPAGPVPIPYPNTGVASDTSDGSKTVQISGQEVMLKDSSDFKKSTGDEAATKSLGMNVITHQIQGKCYFTSWSMDVKIEGENAVRHLDLMTHNHASTPGGTPPWSYQDLAAFGNVPECKKETDKARKECQGAHAGPGGCTEECKKAKACLLVPKGRDKELCCHPDNTGHHMIEDHWVKGNAAFPMAQGNAGYEGAPCVCVNAKRSEGSHQSMHNVQGVYEESFLAGGANAGQTFTYGEGKRAALNAHDATFGDSGCSQECMEAQLDSYYGGENDRPLNQPTRRQPLGGAPRAETTANWGAAVGSPG